MGPWHPESPARLDAINDQLLASGLMGLLRQETSIPASRDDLLRVHTARHVACLEALSPASGYAEIDPDTFMNPHSMEAALAAAGAGITAVDAVMRGDAGTAFCAVRPPGHHALSDRAMGFCLFNNVAVAAAHLIDHHGIERVAIVDFDVHHGNGTEQIFAGNDKVLMCGFYQHPFFPDMHVNARNMVNVPVAAYSPASVVRELVADAWLPCLRAFRPQFVLFSAGFDAHREDDMASLDLVEDDYAWITRQIAEVACVSAGGRMVSLLEGGYNLSALGRSVAAHIKALAKL